MKHDCCPWDTFLTISSLQEEHRDVRSLGCWDPGPVEDRGGAGTWQGKLEAPKNCNAKLYYLQVMVFCLLHSSGEKFGPYFIPQDRNIDQHLYHWILAHR